MKYIISAGGTGGHIYPALSMADYLSRENEVIFIAADKELDHDIIEKHNPKYEVRYWKMSGFSREKKITSIFKNIGNIFKLISLLIRSKILLFKFKPDGVVGFGGYITFPIVYMASFSKAKTIIHEQNSYPGLVNRRLAKRVDKIALSYMSAVEYFGKEKVEYTSNPRAYVAKNYQSHSRPKNFKEERINVLVLGGSLGAEKINDLIIDVANIDKDKVYHLAVGKRYYNEYKDTASENLFIYEYLNNVFDYIVHSDIVVTRAGATTLLELVYLNKKIIAIPSPNVTANHQMLNAKELEKKGLLKVVDEKYLTSKILSDMINVNLEKKNGENKIEEENPFIKFERLLKE